MNYIKAAEMYRKVKDNPAAIKALELAVKLLLDDGKFVKAAQIQKQVAEIATEEGRLLGKLATVPPLFCFI